MHDHREGARDVAREFRKTPTKTEKIVWRWLRGRRCGEWKFRRQYPIGPYIVDFYCDELKLVVEIDGAAHASTGDYDIKRERDLRAAGIEVVHIANDRVLNDADGVIETILLAMTSPSPAASRRPLPEGEG